MGRDGEGASNVNMPSSIENTTVVNNQYLQQELQTGLATKQDKLTAGTNITIEDNVISASRDLATRAELVSFDNSNTQLQLMKALVNYTKADIDVMRADGLWYTLNQDLGQDAFFRKLIGCDFVSMFYRLPSIEFDYTKVRAIIEYYK